MDVPPHIAKLFTIHVPFVFPEIQQHNQYQVGKVADAGTREQVGNYRLKEVVQ